MIVEVLIVGAGPSGALAAALLCRQGLRVLLLEREQFPRFSIGESLLPQSMEYLEQAGIATDMAGRTRLYNNFQVRWSEELPALALFYPVYTYAVSNEVQGVSIGPIFDLADRLNKVTDWFLVTRSATGESTITPTP